MKILVVDNYNDFCKIFTREKTEIITRTIFYCFDEKIYNEKVNNVLLVENSININKQKYSLNHVATH